MTPDDYLGPEASARLKIDTMLAASGWVVQDFKKIALVDARDNNNDVIPWRDATPSTEASTR
jgi:hypothetical protein